MSETTIARRGIIELARLLRGNEAARLEYMRERQAASAYGSACWRIATRNTPAGASLQEEVDAMRRYAIQAIEDARKEVTP